MLPKNIIQRRKNNMKYTKAASKLLNELSPKFEEAKKTGNDNIMNNVKSKLREFAIQQHLEAAVTLR